MPTIQVEVRDGALHPVGCLPADFREGERLSADLSRPASRQEPISMEESIARIDSAKSLSELIAAANIPVIGEEDDHYDVLQALNNNRLISGGNPILPESEFRP